jgi:hypothetical protein
MFMTYVLSIARDRNIALSSVKELETSVVEVIDLILKDYDINQKLFSTNSIQLRKELIEAVDGAEEEEIDSLVELFLLRNNISEELDSLFTKVKDEISVSTDDDPLWELTIYLEQSKLVLEVYSNIDSDYPWDALLKNID